MYPHVSHIQGIFQIIWSIAISRLLMSTQRANFCSFHLPASMLVWCWTSVCDAGPALNQNWCSVSYLLGSCADPLTWTKTIDLIIHWAPLTKRSERFMAVWNDLINVIKASYTVGWSNYSQKQRSHNKLVSILLEIFRVNLSVWLHKIFMYCGRGLDPK